MLETYLIDTVQRVRQTRDKWGEVETTSYTALNARVEWAQQMVLDFTGQEVISQGVVFLEADVDIKQSDLIRIDGFDYALVSIQDLMDWEVQGKKVFLK